MRILQIHSNGFSYELKKKAIKDAEIVESKSYNTDDSCLINFIASETSDEKDIETIVNLSVEEISKSANEVKEKNLIIYPWVHLSQHPSQSRFALRLLKKIAEKLRFKNFEVINVPFGWYKAFRLQCKGHPLAERSKVIYLQDETKIEKEIIKKEDLTALKAEEKIISKFYIIEPNGTLTNVNKFDYTNYEELRLYVNYEIAKDRTSHEPPPHVNLMKILELVDYEPGSDSGNFRWNPRGLTLKRVVEKRITAEMLDYGAHIVQTPLIYDYHHPSLKSYLERFPSRQYIVRSGKHDYFARFSACFGQFLLISNAQISYKQLPLKLFEIASSYRREQSGELAGLRRPRAFTMPDLHEFVSDIDMAIKSYINQIEFVERLHKELEVDYEVSFRVLKSFLEENNDFINSIIKIINKPVMLEVFEERYAYFILKGEWNVVDGQKKAGCLGTIQIDVENGERFNIEYIDSNGKRNYPIILHTSPSGSIERILYAVLEQASKDIKYGKKPQLPLWMTPVQVRLIPVHEKYIDYCKEISVKFDKFNIRNEIDDRFETLNKKIRSAEKMWIPYICVLGKNEKSTNKLSIRIRENNTQVHMDITELIKEINKKTSFSTRQRLMFPKFISQQAIFSYRF